jgi:nitrogenase subunit NifH
MFSKLHIPVAGIVENMSGFICPSCNTESDIFGTGTCDELANEYNTQVLAHLPIEPAIRVGGDSGKPIVYFEPDNPNILNSDFLTFSFISKDSFLNRVKQLAKKDLFEMSFNGEQLKIEINKPYQGIN